MLQYSKSISSHSFFATRLILYIYVPKHIVLNLTGGIFDIFSETIFFNTLYIENCKFFGFFSIYILFFYFYKNIENSSRYFLDNGSRKINVQFEPCSLKTVGGDRFWKTCKNMWKIGSVGNTVKNVEIFFGKNYFFWKFS